MVRLQKLWVILHGSLWFVPILIVIASILLAVALIMAGSWIDQETLAAWPRLFGAGAAGARSMLATVAGSVATVAGVSFSITIVALSLAASQYTPRILRNFMRDRSNQVVLGILMGVFAYCLVVLRTIRGGDEGAFVPSLAVLFALILALVGICVFIFFIHHIAITIQASNIIAAIADETVAAVNNLFPEELGEAEDQQKTSRSAEGEWRAVPAAESGYIQNIDTEALLRFAERRNVLLRMERGIGEFVIKGTPLISLRGSADLVRDAYDQLDSIYAIDRYRTIEQDAGFGILQIGDIALKALSPGINDTTTAATCVDYLTAILTVLVRRRVPVPDRYSQGELRVISCGSGFEELLQEAFDQIRRNAEGNVVILKRMLLALETLARETHNPRRLLALARQLDAISEVIARSIKAPGDCVELKDRCGRIQSTLRPVTDPIPAARPLVANGDASSPGRSPDHQVID